MSKNLVKSQFIIKETKVVDVNKIYGKRPHYDIYMGRAQTRTEELRKEFPVNSVWCNKYAIKKYGKEATKLFERDFRNNEELMNRLPELVGKELGCWCVRRSWYEKGMCHVNVIIKIMIEKGLIPKSNKKSNNNENKMF